MRSLICLFCILRLTPLSPSKPVLLFDINNHANEVLDNVATRLNSIKSIDYSYKRNTIYGSVKLVSEMKAHCHVSFENSYSNSPLSFEVLTDSAKYIYKDGRLSVLNNENQKAPGRSPASGQQLDTFPYLCNSMITLRRVLPKIVDDTSIAKSIITVKIGQVECFKVSFSLNNQYIDYLGNLRACKTPIAIRYSLIIQKDNFMPVEFIQNNRLNDRIETYFTNIEFKPA